MEKIKQAAIKLIKSLPDDVSWEEIIYELYVRDKIERAEKFVESGGKTYTFKEAQQILK